MASEKIIIETPIIVKGLTLIPIVNQTILHRPYDHGQWVHATKEPLAIVVLERDRQTAYGMDGKYADIDELIDLVPDLRDYVG